MAERLNKRHSDMVRTKIQTSQLINRLENHVLKGAEMSQTQVSSAKILLRKAIPDLRATELTGADGDTLEIVLKTFADSSTP